MSGSTSAQEQSAESHSNIILH